MTARAVLVTGAGSGLGAVIAATLHGAGYRVAVTDVDVNAAEEVAGRLDAACATAWAHRLDVRQKPDWQQALAAVVARWGDVQVLVNNAAVTVARPALEISPEDFDDVMAVNVRGTFLGCQVFGAYFLGRGHGRIINMASLAGQNGGTATGAHYAASKGAIATLTKVFARDLAAGGVTVNAIAPGPLDTPMVHRTLPPDRLHALRTTIPAGDIGDPRFVAETVVHLASPAARFATGATWDINGGLYMR